jgi:hypothetical protein
MGKNYRCLIDQKLSREQITFHQLDGYKTYPHDIQKLIDFTWQRKSLTTDSNYLYDGLIYGLISYTHSVDKLVCVVQKSTYKSYIGTNVINIDKIADKSLMANALACCVVPVSSDGYIIVGKRNAMLAEDTAYWHVIGGTMEGELHHISGSGGSATSEYRPENPYDLILKELREEVSILPDDIIELYCTGFGISLHNHKYEFVFLAHLHLDAQQALHMATHTQDKIVEHTEFRSIHTSDIDRFMQENNFTPIGQLAIEQGKKWLR